MRRRRRLVVVVVVAAALATAGAIAAARSSHHASSPSPAATGLVVPNHALHPGALNPAVTQATIGTTICVHGWTATIRPPASFTTALKVQEIAAEHLHGTAADYEEDHLISLELGGNPTDPKNLWPEPWQSRGGHLAPSGYGAEAKDHIENKLKAEVCAGTLTLAKAQQEIATDWLTAS